MLCSLLEDQSPSEWLAKSWKQEWELSRPRRTQCYICSPGGAMEGVDLPRLQWTLLNRLHTGSGASKHPWRSGAWQVWGTWANCSPHNYHLSAEQTTLRGRTLSSGTRNEGVAAGHRAEHPNTTHERRRRCVIHSFQRMCCICKSWKIICKQCSLHNCLYTQPSHNIHRHIYCFQNLNMNFFVFSPCWNSAGTTKA